MRSLVLFVGAIALCVLLFTSTSYSEDEHHGEEHKPKAHKTEEHKAEEHVNEEHSTDSKDADKHDADNKHGADDHDTDKHHEGSQEGEKAGGHAEAKEESKAELAQTKPTPIQAKELSEEELKESDEEETEEPAPAHPNGKHSEKTDAVLLLDSSGSMLLTDPARLRDEGAKLFVQFLKPGDRLGIVEFSDQARVVREISPFESSQTTAVSDAISKIGTEGEYTDLLAGMKVATEMLRRNPREEANRVIVVLSDGKLEPNPSVITIPGATTDLINNVLPDLKSQGIRAHTLSFSDKADKDLLSQIALATDGAHWFTPVADKIHESYAELFLVVKKPQILALTSRGFQIDEEVEEATFYINREGSNPIMIRSPGGKEFTATSAGAGMKWFSGTKFDVITLSQPEVGNWEVEGIPSQDGFATVLTDLKLETTWPSNFAASEKILLEARLFEAEKPISLPQMTGVFKYAYQITPTDKISEPIIREFLVDDGTHGDKVARDGVFSHEVIIDDPGDYRLRLLATGPTFERNQQIPFRVKPRIIGLTLVKEEEEEEPLEEVVAEAPGEHAKEGKEEDTAKHGEHGKDAEKKEKKDEHPKGDRFIVTLSNEVASMRELEVKLIAVDEMQKKYALPLTRLGAYREGVQYESPASSLPHPGEYELEASVSAGGAKNKKGKFKSTSSPLTYEKEEEHHGEAQVAVEQKEVEQGPPVFLYLLIITIMNGVALGLAWALAGRIQSGGIVLPTFEPLEPMLATIGKMEAKAAVADLNLNDPMFKDLAGMAPTESSDEGEDSKDNEGEQKVDSLQETEEPAPSEAPSEASPEESGVEEPPKEGSE